MPSVLLAVCLFQCVVCCVLIAVCCLLLVVISLMYAIFNVMIVRCCLSCLYCWRLVGFYC